MEAMKSTYGRQRSGSGSRRFHIRHDLPQKTRSIELLGRSVSFGFFSMIRMVPGTIF